MVCNQGAETVTGVQVRRQGVQAGTMHCRADPVGCLSAAAEPHRVQPDKGYGIRVKGTPQSRSPLLRRTPTICAGGAGRRRPGGGAAAAEAREVDRGGRRRQRRRAVPISCMHMPLALLRCRVASLQAHKETALAHDKELGSLTCKLLGFASSSAMLPAAQPCALGVTAKSTRCCSITSRQARSTAPLSPLASGSLQSAPRARAWRGGWWEALCGKVAAGG